MGGRHVLSALALTLLVASCGKETTPPAPKTEGAAAETLTVKIGSASPLSRTAGHIGIDIRTACSSG